MPDPNKLEALRAAGFKIVETCQFCIAFSESSHNSEWGDCEEILYKHSKHSGEERGASVPVNGWCSKFYPNNAYLETVLNAHLEFYKRD